jgi:hypothetical protein
LRSRDATKRSIEIVGTSQTATWTLHTEEVTDRIVVLVIRVDGFLVPVDEHLALEEPFDVIHVLDL